MTGQLLKEARKAERYWATRRRFLELLEDDPEYEFDIEPRFRRIQVHILKLRGMDFREWDQGVESLDLVDEYLWLISEGRQIDVALMHIEGYLGAKWESAERDKPWIRN